MKSTFLLIFLTAFGFLTVTLAEAPKKAATPKTVQVTSSTPKPAVTGQITAKPTIIPPTYPAIGGASSDRVTTAVRFYQAKGITNTGVAYLVGNFIGESKLDPQSYDGDGGLAWGIAQWHPSRRANGLPDTLEGQLEYAWQEIQRYPALRDALYTNDIAALRYGIRVYEGYSIEGGRFTHAANLLQYLM